jgi:hypothetical protein
MARIYQHRDPELSLLQSAIDEAAIKHKASGGAQSVGDIISSGERPGIEDPMVFQAASLGTDVAHMRATSQTCLQPGPAPGAAAVEGIGEGAKYCISLAFNYAKAKAMGNEAAAAQAWADLHATCGSCDPRYAEAAVQAAEYFKLGNGKIPYVPWKNLPDFVIDDNAQTLPENATIAIVGDWGTGQPEALAVLEAVASKNPQVVIHLGDVYYSGTDPEQQQYFFDNWCRILGLTVDGDRNVTSTTPRTFSLAGNHDMYCGGGPYYKVIQQLGQKASFFCLRNQHWQFIGLDTGYYDHFPGGPCTHLAPGQPEWLADKVNNNGGRKTVLLSHHQLFSNSETFDPKDGSPKGSTNPTLMKEVEAVLPKLNLWLWGHQHEFVAYSDTRVKARCIGHGAYPVGISEIGETSDSIPLDKKIAVAQHGDDFWDNGYALIKLNGANATVTYYALDDQGAERGGPSSEEI